MNAVGGEPDHEHDEPHRAHERLRRPSRQAALAATIGVPAGVTGISTSAIAAPVAAAIAAAGRPQLRREQRQEERGKGAVEAEILRVAERVAGQDSHRRPAHPGDVEEEPGAEQDAPVEAAPAAARQRPGLVHDQL